MKKLILILFIIHCSLFIVHAQQADSTAWALIEAFEQDNPQGSPYFDCLDTKNFIDNIKRRLINPDTFCQGFGSSFCGPSALIAGNLITTRPVAYVQLLLDLYRNGKAVYFNGRDSIWLMPDTLTCSFVGKVLDHDFENKIRKKKGNDFIANSELLSDNHADQMIILCFKYRYPGVFGKETFRKGDATRTLGFGSTVFKQFEIMARDFFALDYKARGASMHDFLPLPKTVWKDLTTACDKGKTVYLMIDAAYFRNESQFVLWGSHFLRLHNIVDKGKTMDLEIWDYGCRRWMHNYKKQRFFNALTGYLIVQ